MSWSKWTSRYYQLVFLSDEYNSSSYLFSSFNCKIVSNNPQWVYPNSHSFFCLLFCFVVIVVVNVFAFAAKHEIYCWNRTVIHVSSPKYEIWNSTKTTIRSSNEILITWEKKIAHISQNVCKNTKKEFISFVLLYSYYQAPKPRS